MKLGAARRDDVAAAVLAVGLAALAAWCAWVIWSTSDLRDEVAANVGALETVRDVRARVRALDGGDAAALAALEQQGAALERAVAGRGPEVRRAVAALGDSLRRIPETPDRDDARRAADEASDRVVVALRAENRAISLELGRRWRWVNAVAVVVLVLSIALLVAVVVARKRRRRAETSEAALRAHTAALRDAALLWSRGDLSTGVPVHAAAGDFATVLEALRVALAQHVDALERRSREVSELANDLRAQLIEKTDALAQLATSSEAGEPLVAGRYALEAPLGRGGMGEVHRARRLSDGRVLALKLMRDPRDKKVRLRFLREARMLAEVEHPNVIRILDVGLHVGQPFLVMELVEGRNLAEDDAPPDLDRARAVLRAVAAGLAAIHHQGIIHRDLKLSNVMVGRAAGGGEVIKIVDFGIAVEAPTTTADTPDPTRALPRRGEDPLTEEGLVIGTMRYLAPERSGALATTASDVFAFGVLAMKLLTGEFPWPVSAVSLVRQRGHLPPPSFERPLPTELRALVLDCLAQAPEHRPTADALVRRLS